MRSVSASRLGIMVAVSELASRFGIAAPRVRTSDGVGSRYFITRQVIVIGLNDWHGVTDALLHEFAHHLVNVRRVCGERSDGEHHGRQFYVALKDTIRAWGSLADYGWHNEYECIWRMAYLERLTARQWFKRENAARRRLEAIAAGNRPAEYLPPGTRVQFAHRGEVIVGELMASRRGARLKVRVGGGRFWRVSAALVSEVK